MILDKSSLKQLDTLRKQASAVNALSQYALSNPPLNRFFDRAFEHITATLDIDHIGIFKARPTSQSLLLYAGVGWRTDLMTEWDATQLGHSPLANTYSIIEDFRQKPHFQYSPLLRDHRILSGMTTAIPDAEGIFGILGMYADEPRTYSDDEVMFAMNIVNIIASVIQRTTQSEKSDEVETQYKTLTRLLTDYAYTAHITNDGELVVDWSGQNLSELDFVINAVNQGGWKQVIHPDDHDIYRERLEALARTETHTSEFRTITADGNIRWIRAHAYPVRNLSDNVLHIYGAWIDITDAKQTEERQHETEQRLHLVLDNIVDGVILVNGDGQIVFLNPAAQNMTGWQADTATGQPVATVFLIMNHNTHEQIDPLDSREHTAFQNNTLLINRDGMKIPISWRIAHLQQDHRISGGAIISFYDVSENIAMQEALRLSEERFKTALKDSPVVVFSQNTDLEYTWIYNPKLGYFGREVIGKRDIDLMERIEDAQIIETLKRQVIESGDGIRREVVIHNTKPYYFDLTIEPLKNQDGSIIGIVAAATDVTVLKEAEGEVRRLNTQLERRVEERTRELTHVNQELEAFSYSVSHDLRTPLRAINGFSQALMEDCSELLGEEGLFFLSRIRSATEEMALLIDDLLRLSRVTRNEIILEDLNLSEMAQQIIEKHRAKHPERQITVQIDDDIRAIGDHHLFNILLENFISNAWKFTRHVSNAHIAFFVEEQDDQLVYVIKDNGAGFDMAYIHKLFKPFQRLHLKEEFEGTGIGLATIKRILQRHHGDVWAEGTINNGATFYFTLPPRERNEYVLY